MPFEVFDRNAAGGHNRNQQLMTEPVSLIPHVWVQKCEPFPDRLAGQLFTSEGRPAYYGANVGQWHHFRLAPIWTQPRTQQGLDDLFDQLAADANRAHRGAA